jgi:hypothetical protein
MLHAAQVVDAWLCHRYRPPPISVRISTMTNIYAHPPSRHGGAGNVLQRANMGCSCRIDPISIPERSRRSIEGQILSAKAHLSPSIPPQSSQKTLVLDSCASVLDISADAENLSQPDLPGREALEFHVGTEHN